MRFVAVQLLIDLPPDHPYHAASIAALNHAAAHVGVGVDLRIIATKAIGDPDRLVTSGSAVFVGPGSPYDDQDAVHEVVRVSRERGVPLVAT